MASYRVGAYIQGIFCLLSKYAAQHNQKIDEKMKAKTDNEIRYRIVESERASGGLPEFFSFNSLVDLTRTHSRPISISWKHV